MQSIRWPLYFTLLVAACKQTPQVPLQAAQPAPGHVRVLDAGGTEGDTGWWPAVAFDAQDRPHVAFCDAHVGDVRYAVEANGTWQVRSVVSKGAVGKYISMDVDPQGHVGIAYYDQDKLYLRYAWPDETGSWQTEAVAWGREVGMGSALRFDLQGRAHLFYYLPSGKFIHATRGSEGWSKEVVATAMGVYSVRTHAIARDDGIWVSFVDWQMRDAALYLGHVDQDGHFTKTLVSNRNGPGWHSQVLFQNKTPTVLHSMELTRQTAISVPDLQGRNENGWSMQTLLTHGSTFVARPWRQQFVVAYQDTSDTKIGGRVRYTQSEGWNVFDVDDDAPVGGYMDMAISRSGRMLLAYYADSVRSLKLYDEQLAPVQKP